MSAPGRRLRTLVAAVAVLLLATGCGASGEIEVGDEDAAELQAFIGGGSSGGSGDYTFALVAHGGPGDSFFNVVEAGAQDAADALGVELLYLTDGDAAQQAKLVGTAVSQGVDGVAVSLAEPDALASAVKGALDAGIPVVSFNAGIDDYADLGVEAYYGQDEYLGGKMAGAAIKAAGASKLLCVNQGEGHVGLAQRCKGAQEAFGGDFELVYVDGNDVPGIQSTVTSTLRADPSIDAVLGLGASVSLAGVAAVEASGSDAKVYSFDMNQDLVDAIDAGTVQFTIDQQPYLQGYLSIQSLWLHVTNGNVPGGGEPVLTGPSLVDKTAAAEIADFVAAGTR